MFRFVLWKVEMPQWGRPNEQEALEMLLHYLRINEPERRQELVAMAEKYAAESSPSIVQDNNDVGESEG